MTDPHNSYDSERLRNIKMFLRSFFSLLGCANWYAGVDHPTLWQRIYKWRIGPRTAYNVSKGWLINTHYEEKKGYENPMESENFWSDRATRIVFRVVALVALVFSVLFAFEIL